MEPGSLLLCTQEPVLAPYSELDESGQELHTALLYIPSELSSHQHTWVLQVNSFLHRLKFGTPFAFPPSWHRHNHNYYLLSSNAIDSLRSRRFGRTYCLPLQVRKAQFGFL
jgi:hypothetical protein